MPLLWIVLSVGMLGQSESSESARENKIQKIKIAYMVNFIRFTVWPESHLPNDDSTLVISMIDNSGFAQKIQGSLSKAKINQHPIQLHIIDELKITDGQIHEEQKNKLLASHVIYYRNAHKSDIEFLTGLQDQPQFLLLGDMKDFAEHGGMIGFKESSSKVGFYVNINAIRQSKIQISSKVSLYVYALI